MSTTIEASDASTGSAEDRIRRMFARFVGAGFVFYLLVLSPKIVGEADLVAWWWTPMAITLIFVPGIGMGVYSFTRDRRWIGILGGAAAAGYLISALSWPVALGQGHISGYSDLWLSPFPGVTTMAAVLAWRWWLVVGHLVTASVVIAVLDHSMFGAQEHGPLLPDIAFSVMFSSIFVSASLVAVRTGRVLDESKAVAQAHAATAAATAAVAVERERFDGLIHDGVMATLLATSRAGNSARLTRQAQVTLTQLDRLRSGADTADSFDAAAMLTLLRSAATDVDENFRVIDQVEPGSEMLRVPPEVARAIAAGVAEALRNSVRHADVPGRTVTRTITLAVRPAGIRAEVTDDGCGFELDLVPEHRLGIAVSIRGRMQQLAGGSAIVHSRPNNGTKVVLAWSKQA